MSAEGNPELLLVIALPVVSSFFCRLIIYGQCVSKLGIMNIQKFVDSMQRLWNSMAISTCANGFLLFEPGNEAKVYTLAASKSVYFFSLCFSIR